MHACIRVPVYMYHASGFWLRRVHLVTQFGVHCSVALVCTRGVLWVGAFALSLGCNEAAAVATVCVGLAAVCGVCWLARLGLLQKKNRLIYVFYYTITILLEVCQLVVEREQHTRSH